jgi:hypothetical protein
MNAVWSTLECETGRIYACAIAQLRLWLLRSPQGWLTCARHEAAVEFEPLHAVDASAEWFEWHRCVTPSVDASARLVPALPDKPVMTRPEARIEIAPRHKGLFYVTVPVWARAEVFGAAGARPLSLCEHPTRVLSRTWFGHPAEEGEVGYALTTRARQGLENLTDVDGRAICPVLVDNGTDQPLAFSQLQLRVRHMSLYQSEDGWLWTNECRLSCTGSHAGAEITFGRSAPDQARGARLVSGPREAPASGLTARAVLGALFKQPL